MNDIFHIAQIIKEAYKTIESKNKRIFTFTLFPIMFAFFTVLFMKIKITKDYVGIILSSLSIFAGFFFTLIVYVTDKAANKKREFNIKIDKQEEEKEALATYLEFCEKLIIQISYSIVFCIIIVFSVLTTQYDFCVLDNYDLIVIQNTVSEWITICCNIISIALIYHFVVYLLLIVSNMYALFLNEVKQ
ncbi:hypothetical protein SAMN05421780_11913 [Flexibacter flexilis DSM 6793]|uniref:Uncharacterized protein n=1 Tax=Flexibacter flexilis DSM 6793 TaxID=927664 RepID=A0A1I1P475_9BACT|nr:hypothetical protein [Flexibacter flexilis]SFD00750.1 hypothetical protein SAMN05421780_11913 [Flexibacter flexilis DSM 6793]